MNAKEQRRIIVLTEVVSGILSIAAAADCLQVSERHTKRLLAAFRRGGGAALVHGNRGRQPAHTLPIEVRQQVRRLATEKDEGCNHQRLTEQLSDGEGIIVSRASV